MNSLRTVSITAAAVATLVALSGCVAYPADARYDREHYGSDAEWQRNHHRDHRDHRDYDDRDTRDERARGQ